LPIFDLSLTRRCRLASEAADMRLTSRRRDLVRVGVTSLTALAGAGSLTAVGWLAGTADKQHTLDQQTADARKAAAAAKPTPARTRYEVAWAQRRADASPRRVFWRSRPVRTVVRTEYVAAASGPVTVTGGTVSAPAPAPQGPAPRPVVRHAPPPPPPPPAPAPAPSSGS
jgi:hypothetical protein